MNRIARYILFAALLAVIAPATVIADPCNGPGESTFRVDSYSNREFEVCFSGAEFGRVVVEGDGDTDLDLYVYDARGRLVSDDTDGTDYCIGTFYTPYTQTYRIKVVNYGGVYNEFTIRVD